MQVGDAKFVFESKTIQRMELLVLSTLKWRMQALTPFSFIDYFLYKTNGDQMPPRTLMLQCIQLILSTIKGTLYTYYYSSKLPFFYHYNPLSLSLKRVVGKGRNRETENGV